MCSVAGGGVRGEGVVAGSESGAAVGVAEGTTWSMTATGFLSGRGSIGRVVMLVSDWHHAEVEGLL